eukprot:CAMPEP_0172718692 /NCGR_PEP_ID=MMETSP1074-20121228/75080_1 /TAXON_ID=2916 /ORGANISM="Ceratium fusus, Strain PA161109" /LENGTH=109 /DNA_ID=CAMNT_0013543959 /DNA_START=45 /DNA_END=374 /DNA_ORIENTATION=-
MASFMFFGFLQAHQPHYEERTDHAVDGKRLRELWSEMEEKCFNRYLDEANDDFRGVHPYELLKHEVSECRKIMKHDNRKEVLQECTSKVVTLYKRCAHLDNPGQLSNRE